MNSTLATAGPAFIGDCHIGDRRVRRARKGAAPAAFDFGLLRQDEIESVIRARHGNVLPDARATDDLPTVLAYLTAAAGARADVDTWSRRWLPWLDDVAVLQAARELSAEFTKRNCTFSADHTARLLSIALEERTRLGLKTIGACDLSTEERAEIARAKKQDDDRERQVQLRRASGSQTRAEWLAGCPARSKPWLALGISRASWYRRQQRETGPSRVFFPTGAREQTVSPQRGCIELPPDRRTSPIGGAHQVALEAQQLSPETAAPGRRGAVDPIQVSSRPESAAVDGGCAGFGGLAPGGVVRQGRSPAGAREQRGSANG